MKDDNFIYLDDLQKSIENSKLGIVNYSFGTFRWSDIRDAIEFSNSATSDIFEWNDTVSANTYDWTNVVSLNTNISAPVHYNSNEPIDQVSSD